jgi:autotransporter-associated beta strand protein
MTLFQDRAMAASATLIANGGANGGGGGLIQLLGQAKGGMARVEVFGNGSLDISQHGGLVTIGSLEGDGQVFLGSNDLTIGASGLSTTFSGIIQESGSLTKTGNGTLTLSGANVYTAGTTVSAGTLVLTNTTGLGTGTGAVSVTAGTLGGSGTVSGAVTIGTGGGTGAFLAPAVGTNKQAILTIQSGLTFNSDSTYTYTFKAKKNKARTDKVIANGVTMNSGASFNLSGTAKGTLKQGLTFTVISNTASTPISGTFSNLADGAIISVNGNNFQADYEGGDGNNLTLTVVP